MAKEGFLGKNEEPSEDEVDDMMDIVDEADEEMDEAGCLVYEADRSFIATRTQELPCY